MGNLFKIFLLIGLLAGYTQTVHSNSPGPFSCWNCDSLEQQNCGEDFDVNGIEPLNCIKEPFPMHLYNIVGTLNRNVTGCMKTTTTKEAGDNTDGLSEEEKETSILCYHCSSMDDERCSEDFEESAVYAIDCKRYLMSRYLIHVFGRDNANATGCLKTTATGSAIRCYSCTSESNEACGDDKLNLETKNELDCNTLNAPSFLGSALATGLSLLKSSATGCSKITSKINDKTAIVRTCFWGNVDDTSTCYDKDKNTDGVKMECNVCTNDLCNGATTTTTTYGIAVFLTALMGRFLF